MMPHKGLKGRKATFFWHSSVGDRVIQFTAPSLLQDVLPRSSHTAVYCLAEEGIPRLVPIRAHNKSHVPLLLAARGRRSIGP